MLRAFMRFKGIKNRLLLAANKVPANHQNNAALLYLFEASARYAKETPLKLQKFPGPRLHPLHEDPEYRKAFLELAKKSRPNLPKL